MKFVNSPKIEYHPDGLPRARESRWQIYFRLIVTVSLLLALGLNLYVFLRSDIANLTLNNNSGAEGLVVDSENRALANVLVFSADVPTVSTSTDANGRFLLKNLPAGVNRLVVVRNNVGQEFYVTLTANQTTRIDYLNFSAPLEDIE